MYTVSTRMKTRHAEVCRPPLAANGRKWKTRYSSKMLNDAITKVLRNKHVAPTARRDVVKTLANRKKDSEVVLYNTAWRAVNRDTMVTKRLGYNSFQLVRPYTEELARTNPGSVLGFFTACADHQQHSRSPQTSTGSTRSSQRHCHCHCHDWRQHNHQHCSPLEVLTTDGRDINEKLIVLIIVMR